MKLVGFGHSHILALRFAAGQFKDEFDTLGVKVTTNCLGEERFFRSRDRSSTNDEGRYEFCKEIKKEIALIKPDEDIVFTCFGGNAHNVLGLVAHPTPFDLRLQDESLDNAKNDVDIIPIGIIEDIMKSQGGFPETVWCLRALRKCYSGKLFHCESPPPIDDENYLLEHAGVFDEMFKKNGISSPAIRHKLWHIHSDLIKKECESLNISFIPAPSELITEYGFLNENSYAKDPTHANSIYGRAVLFQLLSHRN